MPNEKSISLNSHFQMQWEEKQDCYVLLYPEGMVQLNPTGGEILNLCDGKNSFDDIVSILSKKFSVEEENIKGDIDDFIKEATTKGWIDNE